MMDDLAVLLTQAVVGEEDHEPQLRVAFTALGDRLDAAKERVAHTVSTYGDEFAQWFDTSLQLSRAVGSLASGLRSVLTTIEHPESGVHARLARLGEDHQTLCRQSSVTEHTIAALLFVHEMHEILCRLDGALEKRTYLPAATMGKEAIERLNNTATCPQGVRNARIHAVLKDRFDSKLVRIKYEVTNLLASAIIVEHGSLRVTHHGTVLHDALQAASILGKLPKFLVSLSQKLPDMLLFPLVRMVGARTHTVEDSESGTMMLRIVMESDDDTMDSWSPFAPVRATLLFLAEYVLFNEREWIRIMGDCICTPLVGVLIQSFLEPAVPEEATHLSAFAGTATEAIAFEEALVEMGVCPAEERPLKAFVEDMDIHFADKKRRRLLAQARALMLKVGGDIHRVTPESEAAGFEKFRRSCDGCTTTDQTAVFRFPDCGIMTQTYELLLLVYEALEEACVTKPIWCSQQIYLSVRDIFGLFRAVIPSFHATRFTEVPQLGMLFHNDCMYLAHHLLTLGPLYDQRLPFSPVVFIDFVPALRQLAEDQFSKQMIHQRTLLNEYMDSAAGFRDTQLAPFREKAQATVKRVSFHLERLSHVWKNVLPHDIYVKSLGILTDAVFARVVGSVESLHDISVEESSILHQILSDLLQSPVDMDEEARRRHIPHARKLRSLAEILEMKLEDIMRGFYDGTLDDFSTSELRGLIKALFLDTPLRKQKLAELQGKTR